MIGSSLRPGPSRARSGSPRLRRSVSRPRSRRRTDRCRCSPSTPATPTGSVRPPALARISANGSGLSSPALVGTAAVTSVIAGGRDPRRSREVPARPGSVNSATAPRRSTRSHRSRRRSRRARRRSRSDPMTCFSAKSISDSAYGLTDEHRRAPLTPAADCSSIGEADPFLAAVDQELLILPPGRDGHRACSTRTTSTTSTVGCRRSWPVPTPARRRRHRWGRQVADGQMHCRR